MTAIPWTPAPSPCHTPWQRERRGAVEDSINPELRRRLAARKRQTAFESERREQRAREPYRPRSSDARFWVWFYVIAFIIFAVIGWLVE